MTGTSISIPIGLIVPSIAPVGRNDTSAIIVITRLHVFCLNVPTLPGIKMDHCTVGECFAVAQPSLRPPTSKTR
jgi:hypothetical protein